MSDEGVACATGCLLIFKPTGRESSIRTSFSADGHQRKAGGFDSVLAAAVPPRARGRVLLPKEVSEQSPTDWRGHEGVRGPVN